jgi:hypothetical protein
MVLGAQQQDDRDEVERCYLDTTVEGRWSATLLGTRITHGVPVSFWKMTLDAKVCQECFCSNCKLECCAGDEQDEEYIEGAFDTYSDDDGSWDGEGNFMCRPDCPKRITICADVKPNIEAGTPGKKNCACSKCVDYPATNWEFRQFGGGDAFGNPSMDTVLEAICNQLEGGLPQTSCAEAGPGKGCKEVVIYYD